MEIITNPGVVTMALAAFAVVYVYISAAVKGKKEKSLPEKVKVTAPEASVSSAPKTETATGELVLEGTDEETAAVIMAIVSHESGVPLNRLSFKSIRLMEE